MFAPVSPYGQGMGGFQIGWGSYARPVSNMSAHIYSGGGGGTGGFSLGFGSSYAGIGTYYGFGFGFGGGPGFRRQPGSWGQWGWGRPSYGGNPIARGMRGVAGLADSVFGTTPQGINAIFNQRERAYNDYLGAQRAKRASQQNGQGGEGKAAPRNLGDRANDYFDGIVGDKKKPGKVYNSQGNKQIREWEKEESESNSNIKGREQNLIELAKRVDNWMNGDNSDVKRGEFLAQIDAWRSEGDSIDTERKLLALVAPGIDKPKDIPRNVAEKLMQQLGENRVPEESTAENVFEAYQQMLKDRFGSDYDSIVDNYFDKALSLANEKGGEPVKGVSVSDIVAKGFTEDEAQKIYDRAFNGKSAIAQRRLGKKLKSVEGKSEKEKASAVGGWYLQFVKNETEEERMNDLLTKAISQKTSSTRKVTIDLTAADGTYYSKDGSTYHGGAAAADDKFKYVVVGNKAKVFVKKGSGWKRKTQTSRGTKANYDIGRMIDKLDELTSGSSS